MKRKGNLMSQIESIDNILLAYHQARRGKTGKKEVIKFSENLYDNILKIRDGLRTGTVEIGNYHYFKIYDPKERLICAASFPERVMHHAIMNVCKPRFESNLIFDSYASRSGKGVYAAIDRARLGMARYAYVAKLDVRKCFDSVSHEVLKGLLRRIFKDQRLLQLFDRIIDSYEVTPGCGIPIGNLPSQYFMNLYLSPLDHYMKEVLLVPIYVRYMDDKLLYGNDREKVKEYVSSVTDFVENVLRLKLKTPQIVKTEQGVSFLGYFINKDNILLNRRSKLRFKNKMISYGQLLADGEWSQERYLHQVNSLIAFARKANTYCLCNSICSTIEGDSRLEGAAWR